MDAMPPLTDPMQQFVTSFISVWEALITPMLRFPRMFCPLMACSTPPSLPTNCFDANVPNLEVAATNPTTSSSANPLTSNNPNRKENQMNNHDQDLSGDDAKLVEYSILEVKRNNSKELLSGREVITDDLDDDNYSVRVIKRHSQNKRVKKVDGKDLRVYYTVLARFKRPKTKEEEDYLDGIDKSLKQIAKKYLKK